MNWTFSRPNFSAIRFRSSAISRQAEAMPMSIQICSINLFKPELTAHPLAVNISPTAELAHFPVAIA